jgi:Transglutaminase-like superfamily
MARHLAAKLRRVARLTPKEWSFLAIAIKELALARVRHATTPVDVIFAELRQGPSGETEPGRAAQLEPADLRRLSWAIAAAAARVPWRSDCLLQVLAAERWTRRWGLRGEFHLGVAKDAQDNLVSHAWIRFGDTNVPEGETHAYKVLIAPVQQ